MYLVVLIGAYFILAPLLKNQAITFEKSKWLPFLPALLLLLHWLFQQLELMFAPGGRLDYFSFSILVNPLFILFLFLGLAFYLLAAQPHIMDAVFVGMKNTVRLFVAFAFLALGLISLAQIIQAFSALTKIGVSSNAWVNYARLGVFSTGGLLVALLLSIVLLLVPVCGWVLLQKLLGKATPKWDKLLKLPSRWLGALPLILIGLAVLAQPETFLSALVHYHGCFFVCFHPGKFPGCQPEPGGRRHRQAGGVVFFLSLPLFPQDRRLWQEGPGSYRERKRRHRLFLLLHAKASSASGS